MIKAFSLFEFILVLVLSGFLLAFLIKPFSEFYQLNSQILKTNDLKIQTHLALLRIEKLLQNCIKLNFEQNALTCFIKDDLLFLKNNEPKLLNSTIILENNTSLYSPKSNFKIQLQNRENLYNDKQNFVYIFKNNKIEKLLVLSENNISGNIIGKFIPIRAKLKITLKKDQLEYELKPRFNEELKQSAILTRNISLFEITKDKLKICLTQNKEKYCLEKRLFL